MCFARTGHPEPRSPGRSRGGVRRDAFTLIEVLIATFIFALGILGLLALFAGAAVQQQAASQVTNSVFASNAAEAVVGRVAGRIEYRDNNNQPNPTEFDNLVPRDQWKVLKHFIDAGFDANDPATHTGTLRLRPDNTPNRASFFFVAGAPEQLPLVLYDRPDQVTQNGGGNYTRTGNQQPFTNRVNQFAVSRVHKESLNFIVVRTEAGTLPDPTAFRDIFYTQRTDLPPAYNSPANLRTMVAFSPSSFPGTMVDPNDFIVIDLADRPNPNYRARVEEMRIDDVNASGGMRRVDSVIVPFYEWRSEEIVSLNDRLVFRADETRSDNRRPVLCYSLLYRRTSSDTTQMAVFTYAVRAPSPRAVFVPVESESPNDPKSPLQRVRVRLGYDDERDEYYVERAGGALPSIIQDSNFILRNGAILLIQGDPNASPPIPGSDLPVRIVDTTFDGDGNPVRGYLDRGPRANGKSYLDPLPNDTEVLQAWTIKPTVESEDGTIWKLEPIDTRILQTG